MLVLLLVLFTEIYAIPAFTLPLRPVFDSGSRLKP